VQVVSAWNQKKMPWGQEDSVPTPPIYEISILLPKKFRERLGMRFNLRFQKIWFFFLLKFNMIYTFWIVLMCWCQKWFLKNEKISLTCILTRKVIWKASATAKQALRQFHCRKRIEVSSTGLSFLLIFWLLIRGWD
jgi:hypothetical protein